MTLLVSGQASGDHKTRFVVALEYLEYDPQHSYDPQQGYRGAYKAFPINDLYSEFIKKSLDFKYPDNALWNSQAKHQVRVHYSDQVLPFTDGVMVLNNRHGKGVEKLKVLGILKGFTPSGCTHLVDKHHLRLYAHLIADYDPSNVGIKPFKNRHYKNL